MPNEHDDLIVVVGMNCDCRHITGKLVSRLLQEEEGITDEEPPDIVTERVILDKELTCIHCNGTVTYHWRELTDEERAEVIR